MDIVSNEPTQIYNYWTGKVRRQVTDSAGNMYAFIRGGYTRDSICNGLEYFVFVRCVTGSPGGSPGRRSGVAALLWANGSAKADVQAAVSPAPPRPECRSPLPFLALARAARPAAFSLPPHSRTPRSAHAPRPHRRYFNGTYRKVLDCTRVTELCPNMNFGYGESPTLIVDGTDRLWVGCRYNLVYVTGYNTFTYVVDRYSFDDGFWSPSTWGGMSSIGRAVYDNQGSIVFADGTPYSANSLFIRKYNIATGEFTTVAASRVQICTWSQTTANCNLMKANGQVNNVDWYYYRTEGVRGMVAQANGDVLFLDNGGWVWRLLANGTLVNTPVLALPRDNSGEIPQKIAADNYGNLCAVALAPRCPPPPPPPAGCRASLPRFGDSLPSWHEPPSLPLCPFLPFPHPQTQRCTTSYVGFIWAGGYIQQYNLLTGYNTFVAGAGYARPYKNGVRQDTVIARDSDGQGTSASFGYLGLTDITFNAFTGEIYGTTNPIGGWWTGGRLFALRTVRRMPILYFYQNDKVTSSSPPCCDATLLFSDWRGCCRRLR